MDDIREILAHINPAILDYQDWLAVGMGLHAEGLSAADWESWSQQDTARYKPGECFKKWSTFQGPGLGNPVKGGTIVQLAKNQGWRPEYTVSTDDGFELDWDSTIGSGSKEVGVVVRKGWLEGREITEPKQWDPVRDITTYLSTLFEASDLVGYVTETYQTTSKKTGELIHLPKSGHWDRTAGQLIQELEACNGDLGAVFGDYKPEVGAYIRFNPLDGKGCRNENVTDFRFALVESDNMELDEQNALVRELELPIACLVHSGNKSLHAIVRIDANNYPEYQKRVEYLYAICAKNGMVVDTQCKNPARLSRMPGVMRNGQKQFLIATNIGKKSWAEWHEWIEGVNDDLPDPEPLAAVWDDLPPLAPPLIHGVLRQGHKMLLAGPSKAGKSYSLIQLCIGIAEGTQWMSWPCAQGRVLYVNLELDRASCLHRFRDVYQALGLPPSNINNIDIWNLRGKSVPMDKLAPKLIRRSLKRDYIAVVIDPIYKVITGDENSAGEMAHFANQFDTIATELGTAVIYCHHHSKGYQGNKRSMDRASGSGVFARDPDALLDLTELELSDQVMALEQTKAACETARFYLNEYAPAYFDRVASEEMQSEFHLLQHLKRGLNPVQLDKAEAAIEDAKRRAGYKTAWRIEGTLREFPTFAPVDVWFEYPRHRPDLTGELKDLQPEEERPAWQKAIEKRKDPEKKKEERQSELAIAFANLEMDDQGDITTKDLAEQMGVTIRTVWNRLKEHDGFESIKPEDGGPAIVRRKSREA